MASCHRGGGSRFKNGLTMSFLSKLANVFRGDRVNRDLDEEMQSHLDEAVEHGRDPRVFGSLLRTREASRDIKLSAWLDAFHTRIFAPIQSQRQVRQLDAEQADLNSLTIGSQFVLREGDHWLKFWVPTLD